MKNDNSQKPTVEKISIWILEAVEKEWRREPDVMKCRPASQVLGPLKTEHGITDGDIDNAIMFMCAPSRQYLTILNRNDGQAIIPSDNGLSILGRIEQHRLEEKEKRKWSRADKIALVSFIFTVFSFLPAIILVSRQQTKGMQTNQQLQRPIQFLTLHHRNLQIHPSRILRRSSTELERKMA